MHKLPYLTHRLVWFLTLIPSLGFAQFEGSWKRGYLDSVAPQVEIDCRIITYTIENLKLAPVPGDADLYSGFLVVTVAKESIYTPNQMRCNLQETKLDYAGSRTVSWPIEATKELDGRLKASYGQADCIGDWCDRVDAQLASNFFSLEDNGQLGIEEIGQPADRSWRYYFRKKEYEKYVGEIESISVQVQSALANEDCPLLYELMSPTNPAKKIGTKAYVKQCEVNLADRRSRVGTISRELSRTLLLFSQSTEFYGLTQTIVDSRVGGGVEYLLLDKTADKWQWLDHSVR